MKSMLIGSLAVAMMVLVSCTTRDAVMLDSREIIPPPFATPEESAAQAEKSETVKPATELEPLDINEVEAEAAKAAEKEAEAKAAEKEAEKAAQTTVKTYTVQKSDTGLAIARKFGVRWSEIAELNGISDKSILRVGQVLILPENAVEDPSAQKKEAPVAKKSTTGKTTATNVRPIPASGKYTVAHGDSLSRIASKFGLKIDDIRKWNDLKSDRLMPEQVLWVRVPDGFVEPKEEKAEEPQNVETDTTTVGLSDDKYVVKEGDSPWTIAKKCRIKIADLQKWNNLNEKSVLQIGQVLIVKDPNGAMTEPAPAAETKAAEPAAPAATETAANAEPKETAEETTVKIMEHTVQEGESVDSILNEYSMPLAKFKELNPTYQEGAALPVGSKVKVIFQE